MKYLPAAMRRAIKVGRLTLNGPNGFSESLGGDAQGPDVAVRLHDPALDWKLVLNPEINVPEAYMDGTLTIEQGSIYDLIALAMQNYDGLQSASGLKISRGLTRVAKKALTFNPVGRASRNARHHYDTGNAFYKLWLDEDMQYSCGYFPTGGETLEEAQTGKKRHIAAKLGLEPGQRVLDIGCGWGGLSLYLAKLEGVEVTGITLSPEQQTVAQARADALGLSNRVRFELVDYRHVTERFDRIVSVGMLEHVGEAALGTYFRRVRDCLEDEGVALIHSISNRAHVTTPSPFILKHIFPGGHIPTLSEAVGHVEKAGLWVHDAEIWRLHYARTLAHWRQRFGAVRDQVVEMYDETFARMWEYYLAASECSFRYGSNMVMQLQIGLMQDAVPLGREYIAEREADYRHRETRFLKDVHRSADQALKHAA